jgi:signal transduction histidine kinase
MATPSNSPPAPRRRRESHSSLFGAHPESLLDSRLIEQTLGRGENFARWMGWRLRLLVAAALLGCLAVLLTASWLAATPAIPAHWHSTQDGQIALAATTAPQLEPYIGHLLIAVGRGTRVAKDLNSLALQSSARWITSDGEQMRHQRMHIQIAEVLAQDGAVTLTFGDGNQVTVTATERGMVDLGAVFWLLCALALMLYLIAMVVVLAKPSARTLMYAVMSASQVVNLGFMAVESTLMLGLPGLFPLLVLPVRVACDLITGAAIVHAACVHPRTIPGANVIAGLSWVACLSLAGLQAADLLPHVWWWTQIAVGLMGVLTIGVLSWSYRLLNHPFALMMRRFSLLAVCTWVLLSAAMAAIDQLPSAQQQIATIGPTIWYVFLASLLMLMPFLSKSQQVMREFSLLAAISTIATSLDLLFVALFSFSQFASLTMALFLSLGAYAGARTWLINQVRGHNILTTERMFERLYRIAREVENHLDRTPALLSQLLCDLFEPMETLVVHKRSQGVRVVSDGSTLLVPVPLLNPNEPSRPSSIVLRFADRGQRLFTSEDARFADRVVEQLCRAVAFDRAVEQGRSEERLRLAQDLHDDIGARLLTLMYKAQSPEMEEYVRHTLQDLKTLTRGLAAHQHTLAHAAGEWKADLTQRLNAAHMELIWKLHFDQDVSLNVVQWSGLTRVMRELVSNTIAHAQAQQVEVDFRLENDTLELTVTDNGMGRNPRAWAHGLGLGGVRKRVKQLGGEVEWTEAIPHGIQCRVRIQHLSDRP